MIRRYTLPRNVGLGDARTREIPVSGRPLPGPRRTTPDRQRAVRIAVRGAIFVTRSLM